MHRDFYALCAHPDHRRRLDAGANHFGPPGSGDIEHADRHLDHHLFLEYLDDQLGNDDDPIGEHDLRGRPVHDPSPRPRLVLPRLLARPRL